jgi:hypothetical protein
MDMTLSSPIDSDQLRDSLLRFVEERVRLEVLTWQHAAQKEAAHKEAETADLGSRVHISHRAPAWSTAVNAPYSEQSSHSQSPLSRTFEGAHSEGASVSVGGSVQQTPVVTSAETAQVVVRQGGVPGARDSTNLGLSAIPSTSEAGDVGHAGAGARPALLSRASVQAQVDEIQQRLGLFVHR